MRTRSRWAAVAAAGAVAAGLWSGGGGTAHATGGFLALAEAKYPTIVGKRIDSCGLCHRAAIPGLNPYGRALKAANLNFTAIERRDSDGDGFRNLREIKAGTFPGKRRSHP